MVVSHLQASSRSPCSLSPSVPLSCPRCPRSDRSALAISAVGRSDDHSEGSDRKPSTTQSASATVPFGDPLIVLRAAGWWTKADVAAALLHALGAPSWHGHNFDALNDSFTNGMINAVKPPLTLRFVGLSQSTDEVR